MTVIDERTRLQNLIAEIAPVWDQKPDEPPGWYRRFQTYLTTSGTRSILKVANAERENANEPPFPEIPGHWSDASREWQWVIRARQYDRWQALRTRLEQEDERIAAAAARRKVIAQGLDTLGIEVGRLTRRGKTGQPLDKRLARTRVVDLVGSYKVLVDLQRREHGEGETPVKLELSGAVDTSPAPSGDNLITIDADLLLPDELDEMIALVDRINARVESAMADAAAERDPLAAESA